MDAARLLIRAPEIQMPYTDLDFGCRNRGLTLVTRKSKRTYRAAVDTLGLYILREMHYDSTLFWIDDRDDYKAFLLSTYSYKSSSHRLIIGAGCFRNRNDEPPITKEDRWALQWVWIHPFMRKEGWLSFAWPHLHELCPGFSVEQPVSYAMQQFIKKEDETGNFPPLKLS